MRRERVLCYMWDSRERACGRREGIRERYGRSQEGVAEGGIVRSSESGVAVSMWEGLVQRLKLLISYVYSQRRRAGGQDKIA